DGRATRRVGQVPLEMQQPAERLLRGGYLAYGDMPAADHHMIEPECRLYIAPGGPLEQLASGGRGPAGEGIGWRQQRVREDMVQRLSGEPCRSERRKLGIARLIQH